MPPIGRHSPHLEGLAAARGEMVGSKRRDLRIGENETLIRIRNRSLVNIPNGAKEMGLPGAERNGKRSLPLEDCCE